MEFFQKWSNQDGYCHGPKFVHVTEDYNFSITSSHSCIIYFLSSFKKNVCNNWLKCLSIYHSFPAFFIWCFGHVNLHRLSLLLYAPYIQNRKYLGQSAVGLAEPANVTPNAVLALVLGTFLQHFACRPDQWKLSRKTPISSIFSSLAEIFFVLCTVKTNQWERGRRDILRKPLYDSSDCKMPWRF